MGVKDTVTAKYMRQNEIFADAFNFMVYGGEQVIDPQSLRELDTREIAVPYGGEGAAQPVQRARDVLKSVVAMTDRQTAYLLLAVENQSNIHYAMPVRNMVYDALQYAKQVEEAAVSHRRSGDYSGAGSDEYLSGFMKSDRLLPVVTLVIYFDSKEWDGALSIHEMLADSDERVLALVPDYRINLIAPALISDSEFSKFRTKLKEVLSFIKYAKDAKKLDELFSADEGFRHMGKDEVEVLNACVNANLTIAEKEDDDDSITVVERYARYKAEIARKEALKEAEEAAKEAAEQKRINALLGNVKKLMEKLGWSAEEAMDVLEISASDRERLKSDI